jgi:hypothetical protein
MAHKWHDVPVSVDHPQIDGTPVSINHSREVFATHAVGVVQAPRYDPVSRALRAVIRVPDGIRGLEQVKAMQEVSIGVYTENVPETGIWNGKRFVGRTLKADPDHLALLAGPGACDWSAGCGVRTHGGDPIGELREITGQTISSWVQDTLQGVRAMHDYKEQAVFPAEVYAANAEREELQALKEWENHPSPPMEILELRRKHGRGQGQGSGGGYADEAVIPPHIV